MTNPLTLPDHPACLNEYAINAAEYLRQHPEYSVLCTGVVVFDKHGKLLIVQRAADESAFPNMWVSHWVLLLQFHNRLLMHRRRFQEAKWTIPTKPFSMPLYES
jgi:hypothetical protein